MTDTKLEENSRDLSRRLTKDGRTSDAAIVDAMADGLGFEAEARTDGRLRKPQDLTLWPDSLSQEEVEGLIDQLCTCAGKWDCNCVSVFNQVSSQAWYDHNSAESSQTRP